MFHAKNGLYFERTPDGGVRILKTRNGHPDSDVVLDMILDADAWCSIIASVSRDGEELGGFYRAREFDLGERIPPWAVIVS